MKYKIIKEGNQYKVTDENGKLLPKASSFIDPNSNSSTWMKDLLEILEEIHNGKSIQEANYAPNSSEHPEIVSYDEFNITLGEKFTSIDGYNMPPDGKADLIETDELRLILKEVIDTILEP